MRSVQPARQLDWSTFTSDTFLDNAPPTRPCLGHIQEARRLPWPRPTALAADIFTCVVLRGARANCYSMTTAAGGDDDKKRQRFRPNRPPKPQKKGTSPVSYELFCVTLDAFCRRRNTHWGGVVNIY